jgi:hypothetical protein
MAIRLLKIEALRLQHGTDHVDCHYVPETAISAEVSVNGNSIDPLLGTLLYFPDLAPDSQVRIRITPDDKLLYGVEASFVYRETTPGKPGRFDRIGDSAAERAGVARPEGLDLLQNTAGRFTINLFRGYLPTFNEVSARVRKDTRQFAAKHQWSKAENQPDFDIIARMEKEAEGHWMDDPPVIAGRDVLNFKEATVDPRNVIRAFEPPVSARGNALRGPPGLVLVSMPKRLPQGWLARKGDDALSCLLAIRPSTAGRYYSVHPYPWDMNYLWDAGIKYLGMLGLDPILQKHPESPKGKEKLSGYRDKTEIGTEGNNSSLEHVGLAHQAAAAGRRMAIILPVMAPQGLGRFDDAAAAHTAICDIYAWELRSHEMYYGPPNLGPCAVSGFSFGNITLANWLNHNKGSLFADRVVRQVYSMDAPTTGPEDEQQLVKIIKAAEAWAGREGPEPASGYYNDEPKVIRVYNQAQGHKVLSDFKPEGTRFPKAPFFSSNGDTRTFVSMPPSALTRTARSLDPDSIRLWPDPGYGGGDHEAHQIINATAFVDALRRSGFPELTIEDNDDID